MFRSLARMFHVPLATLIGSALCTVALLAQTAQTPAFPNAPQGFDVPRQGIAVDSLFNISEGVHNYLVDQKVPHVWHIDVGGAHTFPVWKNNLYHLSTLLFR